MEVSEEKQKKLTELLDLNPPSMGRIVHYLSPRSTKPIMVGLIVTIRQADEDKKTGSVDLHVFHPNSSGTNIVYSAKFSDGPAEGCWWWPPKVEPKQVQQELAKNPNHKGNK